ncbi:MAG: KH domain-containing protein, partial [Actinobacteria bacterium]|nr:KH domain-containing protein [Actinomycetota bacterium]
VVNELRGEKVDVVQWREDVGQFIAEALGPAKVKEVHVDHENKTADVVVSEHQLSLAIGKEGQNARLAARLSGYKVDIRSDTETVPDEVAQVVDSAPDTETVPDEVAQVVDEAGDTETVGDDEDRVVDEAGDTESE